jgi:hypothetical protein
MKREAWESIEEHELDPRVHGLEKMLEKRFESASIHFPIRGDQPQPQLTFRDLKYMAKETSIASAHFYFGVTSMSITAEEISPEGDEIKLDIEVKGKFTGRDLEGFAKIMLVYKGIKELRIIPGPELKEPLVTESPDTTPPNPPSQ